MDYLKTHARASAQALLVICRYLAIRPDGLSVAELQDALQPSMLVKPHQPREGLLGPSIRVGEHLGILTQAGPAKSPRWRLTDDIDATLLADSPSGSRAFYGMVLHEICMRGLAAAENGTDLSDVALGFVWLSMQDPLTHLSTNWNEGPEDAIVAADLRAAIVNEYEWRPFYRWAHVLGLATETSTGKGSQVTPDCTRAVRGVLQVLPRRSSADQWFRQLRSLLPVLGHPGLVELLPRPPAPSEVIGGSLALAVHKLERAGHLGLTPSADATNAVVVQLGHKSRTISQVEVLEVAA